MTTFEEIHLDRSTDRLGRRCRRKLTARREFLAKWFSLGCRLVRLILTAYKVGQGRLTLNICVRLVRQRRNPRSGSDDVITIALDVRVADMANEDVLVRHYEHLAPGDLFSRAALIRETRKCKPAPPAKRR